MTGTSRPPSSQLRPTSSHRKRPPRRRSTAPALRITTLLDEAIPDVVDTPRQFVCPVTHRIMEDPVATIDGQIYERHAIEEWFRRKKITSPMTGLALPSLEVKPDESLRDSINTFLRRRPIDGITDNNALLPRLCVATLHGHTNWVTGVAAVGCDRLVSASRDGSVKIWNVAGNGQCLRTMSGHGDWVRSVTALGKNRFASSSDDGVIKTWDTEAGRCLASIQGHEKPVWSMAALEGGQFASCSEDGTAKLWAPRSRGLEKLGVLRLEDELCSPLWSSVAFDAQHLATGSDNGMICIWNVENQICLNNFHVAAAPVRSVASLSATCLACGSDDGTVTLFDTSQNSKWLLSPHKRRLATLEGHEGRIRSLATLSARRLASSSDDGTIKIWDVGSRRCLLTFEGHKDWVRAVAALGEERLASGSDDATIKIWGP
mmetsp:Transcript_7287/g.11742  ORF Transcript_7287/g.11742 Transcript_7287/m.11742 type:complete len:432 (-) Transcript_7287:154-1449(-)